MVADAFPKDACTGLRVGATVGAGVGGGSTLGSSVTSSVMTNLISNTGITVSGILVDGKLGFANVGTLGFVDVVLLAIPGW